MTDGSGDHPAAASLTQLRDRVAAQVMEAVAAVLSVTRRRPRELGP